MRGACLLDIPFRTVMEREERPFLVDRTADAVRTLLAIGVTTPVGKSDRSPTSSAPAIDVGCRYMAVS